MRVALVVALLALASPAAAAPFVLPSSDGYPPGTLADILGLSPSAFVVGRPIFDAGDYRLTILGGVTAWDTVNAIGMSTVEGAHAILLAPGLAAPGAVVAIHAPAAWWLWLTSPSVALAPSTGAQWVWVDGAPTGCGPRVPLFGVEDIAVGTGDDDYQDVWGCLAPLSVAPDPPPAGEPVPEPGAVWLTLAGLAVVMAARARRGPAGRFWV